MRQSERISFAPRTDETVTVKTSFGLQFVLGVITRKLVFTACPADGPCALGDTICNLFHSASIDDDSSLYAWVSSFLPPLDAVLASQLLQQLCFKIADEYALWEFVSQKEAFLKTLEQEPWQ